MMTTGNTDVICSKTSSGSFSLASQPSTQTPGIAVHMFEYSDSSMLLGELSSTNHTIILKMTVTENDPEVVVNR